MPVEPKSVASTGKVSLDEKSARAIARGRISQIIAYREEQLRKTIHNLPSKRKAWLRAAQREISLVFGESLIASGVTNRHAVFLCLDPVEKRQGWLAITCCLCRFNREPGVVPVTLISAHAIARLMERRSEVDPITTLTSELLTWTLFTLVDTERAPFAILPTKNGYFTLERDQEHNMYVFTTWLADRQLSDREQKALTTLRIEERLGFGEKLSDLVC